jgi:recombination protein RecR
MEYPSKLIEQAVEEIAKLPGIGKKTALRLALHLLKQDADFTLQLSEALVALREQTRYCEVCFNISDHAVCEICASTRRDKTLVCVVENVQDVIAIENTSQYQGQYHVLGGIISPVAGIGPQDIQLDSLIRRVAAEDSLIREIILALPATMEGDTTSFYITRKLADYEVRVSTIARGIPVGGELEFTDEITLGRSIRMRTQYSESNGQAGS